MEKVAVPEYSEKDDNVLKRWETLFQRKNLILPAGEKAHFIWRQEHHRCKNTITLEIFWMNNKTITLIIISLPNIANISMTNNKRNSISKMGGSESRICRRDLWGTEKKSYSDSLTNNKTRNWTQNKTKKFLCNSCRANRSNVKTNLVIA